MDFCIYSPRRLLLFCFSSTIKSQQLHQQSYKLPNQLLIYLLHSINLWDFQQNNNKMSSISSSTYLSTSSTSSSRKYQHTGRGGAGNYLKAPTPLASSSASIMSTDSTSSGRSRFSSGIGGAGNIHETSSFSFGTFVKELSRKRPTVQEPTVYRFGVGGAGNIQQ